jgi:hypothetical protein
VLQARILTLILVGMSVFSALMQLAWPSLAGTLVAVALGYLFAGGKLGPIIALLPQRQRRARGFEVLEGGRGKRGKGYVN